MDACACVLKCGGGVCVSGVIVGGCSEMFPYN